MNTTPFRIGVSGHQNLGDEATQHFVAQQFRMLLDMYKQQKGQLILYSALAKGADQLFVRAALDAGVPVEVVLPCAAYETIFPPMKRKLSIDVCSMPVRQCISFLLKNARMTPILRLDSGSLTTVTSSSWPGMGFYLWDEEEQVMSQVMPVLSGVLLFTSTP